MRKVTEMFHPTGEILCNTAKLDQSMVWPQLQWVTGEPLGTILGWGQFWQHFEYIMSCSASHILIAQLLHGQDQFSLGPWSSRYKMKLQSTV